MYRIWYWAMIDRESDGRVVASVPDLDDVAVSASTEKDALAYLAALAAERVRAAVEGGQRVPGRRHFTELPSRFRTKEIGRAIIPVEVERTAPCPAPPFDMSQ